MLSASSNGGLGNHGYRGGTSLLSAAAGAMCAAHARNTHLLRLLVAAYRRIWRLKRGRIMGPKADTADKEVLDGSGQESEGKPGSDGGSLPP